MKCYFKILIVVLLCFFSINTTFAKNEEEIVLNNGLRVFIKPMKAAPVVTINYWVKNGSVYESDGEAGFSELISKLLFNCNQLDKQLSNLGVKVSKNSSNDCQSFCFTGISKNFNKILELTFDGMFNANFTEKDIKESIGNLKKEIEVLESRPDVVVHNAMMQEAFSVHPCRRPYYGLNPNFEGADLFFVNRFYTKNYTPSNSILIITGDVEPSSVIESLNKLKEKIKSSSFNEPELPKETAQTSYREIVKYADLNKVYLSFGWKIPNLETTDKYALYILAKLLGGNEESILWKRLVKGRKTCEFICAGYEVSRFQGVFVVSAISSKSKYRYFVDDVRRIANGFLDELITEQTLEELKKSIINEDIFECESVESCALDYGYFAVVNKASDADYFPKGILSVNTEDVKRVAGEFLRDENLSVAILQAPTVSEDATPFMITLDNGIKVILKENHASPVISVSTKFVAECLKEDKKSAGIGCLAGELLYRSLDSDDKSFKSKFEKLGAKLSYQATKNYISLDLKTVSSNFIPAFDLLIKMIDKPEFPTAYSKARNVLEEKLKEESGDIGLQNEYSGVRSLFGNTPLSYSVYGKLDDLSKIKRNDVIDFYKKNFIPSNMVIAIVGDFYASELRDYLLSSLGGFSASSNKNNKDNKSSSEVESSKSDSSAFTKIKSNEAYITFVSKSVPTNDKRFIPFTLACKILNENLKNSFLKADNTGLMSSSIDISNKSFINDGYFKASLITKNENISTASKLLKLEIDAFKISNILDSKIQELKDTLYTEYTLELTDSMALANVFSRDEVLGFGFDYYKKIENILASITAKDVIEAAKELMIPENKYFISVSSDNVNDLKMEDGIIVIKEKLKEDENKDNKDNKDKNAKNSKDNKDSKLEKSSNNNKDSKSDKTSNNKNTKVEKSENNSESNKKNNNDTKK